jgi:hypothetical protein
MRPDLLLVKDYVSSLSMPTGILHLRVEQRHLDIGAKRPVKSGLFEVEGWGLRTVV